MTPQEEKTGQGGAGRTFAALGLVAGLVLSAFSVGIMAAVLAHALGTSEFGQGVIFAAVGLGFWPAMAWPIERADAPTGDS